MLKEATSKRTLPAWRMCVLLADKSVEFILGRDTGAADGKYVMSTRLIGDTVSLNTREIVSIPFSFTKIWGHVNSASMVFNVGPGSLFTGFASANRFSHFPGVRLGRSALDDPVCCSCSCECRRASDW